jgi:phasin
MTMLKNPMANFEIPTEMRNLAEQSVEQAKKAFDDFITAAQKAVTAVEGQTAGAKASTKNIGEKAMAFAEKNVATSFEFAQKVVRAKGIQELTQLQTDFVKTQMPAFVEQARALGQTVAQDAVRPTT